MLCHVLPPFQSQKLGPGDKEQLDTGGGEGFARGAPATAVGLPAGAGGKSDPPYLVLRWGGGGGNQRKAVKIDAFPSATLGNESCYFGFQGWLPWLFNIQGK